MNVSLKRFLREGTLGELQPGSLAQQVRDLLGFPDAVGGTSRKYPHPAIYLYGTLELWFQQQFLYGMTGVYWDAEHKGAFRLPACCYVEDWALIPFMRLADVENWLLENRFDFLRLPEPTSERSIRLELPSRVQVVFNQDEQLASIYGGSA